MSATVLEFRQTGETRPAPGASTPLTRLLVRHPGRIVVVPVHEVDWIAAADYYAELHVAGRRHLVRESLTSLAERLAAEQFVRVHRSAIVNLDRIREIKPYDNTRHFVVLRCGSKIPLSRKGRLALEEALGQRI